VTTADRAPDDDIRRRLLEAMAVLREVVDAPEMVNELDATEKADFLNAAGDVFSPDPDIRRRRTKLLQQQRRTARLRRDDDVLAETGIRTLRSRQVFTTPDVFAPDAFEQRDVDDDLNGPPVRETLDAQHCYICKLRYHEVHHFYDQLCPSCAAFNFAKRGELADMTGMVVLLTGGRVKIGYQAGIKLLRSGAELIVATRFPRDAAKRYAAEADFDDWRDRLEVFGLDLRHTPSVEAFCAHVSSTRTRLDAIINNACQTVRRPPGFYEHMMDVETAALDSLPADVLQLVGSYEEVRNGHQAIASSPVSSASPAAPESATESDGVVRTDAAAAIPGITRASELSQTVLLPDDRSTDTTLFPDGQLDQDLQQIDLRGRNSWRLQLHEVSTVELLETQLVNAVAPFVLNARLKSLMEATPGSHKHIVNVSAVEGQFYRPRKTTKHPHTNMAKAALNMMTRTSATDYHASGINMNSVDTGWVSDEDPVAVAEAKTAEHRFHPPLDIVDGAARIVDPIIDGLNSGVHVWGQFLKDYQPTDW
jgi:NAD(P)-dependent dehydrogenase (short-subunit alcohol dehydrogenase family)